MKKIFFICIFSLCNALALFSQNADTLLKEAIYHQSEELCEKARKVDNLEDYRKILDVACDMLNENMDNKPLVLELQHFMFLIINADPDMITPKQKQTATEYLKRVNYLGFSESIWLDSIGALNEVLEDERISMDPIARILIKAKHGDAEALNILRNNVKNVGFHGEKLDYEKARNELRENPDFDFKVATWNPSYWDVLYVGTPDLVDIVIEAFLADSKIEFPNGQLPPVYPAYWAMDALKDAVAEFPVYDIKMLSDKCLELSRKWVRQNRSSIKLKKRLPLPYWTGYMPRNIDTLK